MNADDLGSEALFGQRDPVIAVREIAVERASRGRTQHAHRAIGRFEFGKHIRYRDVHLIADVSDDLHEVFRWRRYFFGKMQRIE